MSVTIDNAIQLVHIPGSGPSMQLPSHRMAPGNTLAEEEAEEEEEDDDEEAAAEPGGEKGSFGVLSDILLMTRHNDSI